ncbi:calreticulin isoform X3 [Phocoena sinus]|uniref:calreticulin isoform X3 n=1 Tax=Phocoena sinus TaxID=42100 RepID=UPI0013C51858|nr:calreticulin isoform X3 [Phocoena sinus]
MLLPVLVLLGLLGLGAAEPAVYFKEQFLDGDGWTERWIESKHKPDFGKFVLSSGKFYGDQEKDKGLQTSQDARFYALSGKNVLINKDIRCKDDEFTHLYTLIVRPDNTYEVKIDNSQVESGSLEDDWDFLPPKKIKDPDAAKPEDWDERAKVDDPTDSKPEDWDKPEHIPDPDAKKPEDWDEEMDGEWEPPVIQNPEYKGEWKPRQIDNPDYKGIWIHPEIDNPEYSPDSNIYAYENFAVLGLDLWQVKSGTIFDNFLITNDEAYAEEFGNETWGVTKVGPGSSPGLGGGQGCQGSPGPEVCGLHTGSRKTNEGQARRRAEAKGGGGGEEAQGRGGGRQGRGGGQG